MKRKAAEEARAVGIGFQGECVFAVMRGDKTVDRISISVTPGAPVYSPADVRAWLRKVEREVDKKIADLNGAN